MFKLKNYKKIYPVKFDFYFTGITFTLIIFFSFFCVVKSSEAAITFTDGKWETTFDCAEWTGPQASGDIGCGLVRGGNYEAIGDSATYWDQITTAANYSVGGGSRGLRQWVIGTGDELTEADATFGKTIKFSTPQYAIWVRFYVRYQEGFYFHPADKGGEKLLYFVKPSGANLLYSTIGTGSNHVFIYATSTGTGAVKYSTYRFEDFFGSASDESWHYIEVYIKSETVSVAPFDGIYRMWCDGTLILEDTGVNFGILPTGIGGVSPQHNFHGLPDFDAKYIDFDDIVIYNTTPPNTDSEGNPYIGPIESSDTTPPSHPTGLNVE